MGFSALSRKNAWLNHGGINSQLTSLLVQLSFTPHSADTKANLGIKNLEKVKPEKIAEQRFQAFIC